MFRKKLQPSPFYSERHSEETNLWCHLKMFILGKVILQYIVQTLKGLVCTMSVYL